MVERIGLLTPELILLAGTVVLAIMGVSRRASVRDALPWTLVGLLIAAAVAVAPSYRGAPLDLLLMPMLGKYVKIMVCVVGILLTLLSVGLMDRRLEADVRAGRTTFDPLRASRGEYYVFFLLSLIGVMLCTSASDLIWLILALELTSLPTYIMVAMSRPARAAQEASVKYFFLGAMASALLLYGFALIYGATGTVELTRMREIFVAARLTPEGTLPLMAIVGLVLATLGLAFKIAAAPMHFYAADVYEGAAAPVTAFLGFVPKTAGMIALILLLTTVGWGDPTGIDGNATILPAPILTTLWMVSVLTMTLGNIGALLQKSVKRMLAYSSIAHSGYLLIGVIAGPRLGINAVLFYLLVYGLMNTGAFAVLTGLERRGQEIESIDDLAGLRQRHPAMAWAMAICAGSLLGFPPLLGFIGKLYLFMAGVKSGQIALVVIAALNSAISAWYYLQLVALPILKAPSARSETIESAPARWPRVAAVTVAVAMVVLPFFASRLIDAAAAVTADPIVVVAGE